MVVTEVLAIVLWSFTTNKSCTCEAPGLATWIPFSSLLSGLTRAFSLCYRELSSFLPEIFGGGSIFILECFSWKSNSFSSQTSFKNIYLLFNVCVCMYMGVCTCIYHGTLLCARFWGDVNKPLLTQDGELMTDQSKDVSRVQFGEPRNFYLDTNRSILRGYLQEQGRLKTTCSTWSPP